MKQQRAQQIFQTMIHSKLWRFDPDLHTIDYHQYLEIINKLEPQNYEIAYNISGHNYIEKGTIEYGPNNLPEAIRKERTWKFNNMQAFELAITSIPSLILVGNAKQEEPSTLMTTFWVDTDGVVQAYRQLLNGATVHDNNYIKE